MDNPQVGERYRGKLSQKMVIVVAVGLEYDCIKFRFEHNGKSCKMWRKYFLEHYTLIEEVK